MAERGLDGIYLFELEAHPGWPQGRSVKMTGSKPIHTSSDPDAASPGLAHSFLMAQSPTLRRPRRPVPATFSQPHFRAKGNRGSTATRTNTIMPGKILG